MSASREAVLAKVIDALLPPGVLARGCYAGAIAERMLVLDTTSDELAATMLPKHKEAAVRARLEQKGVKL